MATSIPEGHAFVPFGDNPQATALGLLKAADEVEGREQHDVLTVTNGFHVPEDIAEAYGKSFSDEQGGVEEAERVTEINAPVDSDPAAGEGADEIAARNPNSTELAGDAEAEDIPEGDPTGDWNHKQLDAYAAKHGIDLSGKTTKADKLDAIGAAS